jgi:hypothetical protein
MGCPRLTKIDHSHSFSFFSNDQLEVNVVDKSSQLDLIWVIQGELKFILTSFVLLVGN